MPETEISIEWQHLTLFFLWCHADPRMAGAQVQMTSDGSGRVLRGAEVLLSWDTLEEGEAALILAARRAGWKGAAQ